MESLHFNDVHSAKTKNEAVFDAKLYATAEHSGFVKTYLKKSSEIVTNASCTFSDVVEGKNRESLSDEKMYLILNHKFHN